MGISRHTVLGSVAVFSALALGCSPAAESDVLGGAPDPQAPDTAISAPAEEPSGGAVAEPSALPNNANVTTHAAADQRTCSYGIQTAAGCTAAYDIRELASLEGIIATCADGNSLYNGCEASPIAVHWQDHGSSAPKSVKVEIQTSVFCADPTLAPEEKQIQALHFNGFEDPIGSFEGDLAACTCSAEGQTHVYELEGAALEQYKVGANNVIKIEGPNRCFGLKKNADWGGGFARVTVSY